MSCSVKISCGKNWSGSQRRINSLAEETSACPPNAVSTSSNCACPQQSGSGQPIAASITSSTTTTTTSTTTVTVAVSNPVSNPVITTAINTAVATIAGNQRVVPPRPIKSIAVKKGEDTTKLLKYIDDNVIGKNGTFFGPFGRRKGQ